jgi:diguanylate cyclase (GGDEF)-like protein
VTAPDAIAELARGWRRYEGDPDGAIRAITETAARALHVARAGVWLLDPDDNELTCADLYDAATGVHSSGTTLRRADFPAYFDALGAEEAIAADDAHVDPRTREFTDTYLAPNGIGSLLDAPIRSGLKLVGVVCHEHIGAPRAWTAGETKDAAFLASLASLTLELKQRALREALLAATLESTGEGIFACSDTRVLAFNRRFVEMWRLDVAALRDVHAVRNHLAAHTDPMSSLTSHANEAFAGTGGETVDVLELLDGRVFERSSRPQMVADEVIGRVWSYRDLTMQRRAEAAMRASEARMRDLAIRDGLTGLFNRRYALEQLEDAIQRSVIDGERLAVALMDLDHFKKINDTLGHLTGDAVLRDFARQLDQRLRGSDLVARYGGEEFIVILRRASKDAARRVLDQVRTGLADRNGASELPTYTFSAGVAELGEDGGTPNELLSKADGRLYEAKRGGRDRTV